MDPQEIETKEFFVALRGYDRDEVDAYLKEIAEEHRRVVAELEARLAAQPVESEDPLEHLGANITNVLRTAKESAATILSEAERDAEELTLAAQIDADDIRMQAQRDADEIRAAARTEAEAIRATARAEADGVHAELEAQRAAAQDEAESIVAAARERAAAMEAEAEHLGRQRALSAADEATARLADVIRQQDHVRGRLIETTEEIQLALLALGDPAGEAMEVVRQAVLDR